MRGLCSYMKKAKWITRDLCGKDIEYGGPESAKWIWAWEYCRIHTKKEFIINGEISSAEAYFICDNDFDLYINGTYISLFSGRADIGAVLKNGNNVIAIRAYQTDRPEKFLSAIRGGITVEYRDGKTECTVTDRSWKQLRLCNFGEGKEIENWQTENVGESAREERFEHMKEFELHPSVLRRSAVFSKTFDVSEMPSDAVIRASANGLWQPYINGITPEYRFMPGTMDGRKEYQEFSVKDMIKPGRNEIRIAVGNGWYNCECFGILDAKRLGVICEIELIYKDGKSEITATDESWTVSLSKIYEDDLQFGERFDARIDDTAPEGNAIVINYTPVLARQDYPLMGVSKRIKPVCKKEENGVNIFDFGKNYSGRLKLKLYDAVPGQKIIIRYYEFINKDGRYNQHTYSDVFYPCESDKGGRAEYAVKNMDLYIASGEKYEEYEPVFTYTGIRYAAVYGLNENQRCEAEGVCINALLEKNASLETSCGFVKQLWNMAYESWIGNVMSGPTDCPSREKNYWNGDMQIFAHAACWCTDSSKFLARWTLYGRKLEYGVYGWEDEEYILPWTLYKFYGDTEILRQKYPVAARLAEKRGVFGKSALPVNPHSPYNDHLTCGTNIDKQLFSDCYYCHMLDIMAKTAEVIGRYDDSDIYARKLINAKNEFLKRYENNALLTDNPSSIVLALAFGLFDGKKAQNLAERLVKYLEKNDFRLVTGFHTTRYLPEVLCDYGYADIAWQTVSQREYPSWRYIADTGASTYTESWRGLDTGETSNSMNHFTLGAFTCWFFEYLGGIRINKSSPGLKKIWLEPVFPSGLNDFSAEANTCCGKVKSSWKRKEKGIEYTFTVPFGASAAVVLDGKETEYPPGIHTTIIS